MALIRAGGGVAQASGAVGGLVFSHNRGGAYIRARSVPDQPRTAYQLAIRAALAGASSAWDDLDDAGRSAWAAWAANNPVMNRLGDSVTLQGNAAFTEINTRQLFLGKALITTPPTSQAPSPLLSLTATYNIGAGTTQLTYTATPLGATEYLYVQGCLLLSPGIKFVTNRLRFCGLSAAAQASPYDYSTHFEARLGSMAVGNKVVMLASVYDSSSGLLSAPLRVEGIVTSTP